MCSAAAERKQPSAIDARVGVEGNLLCHANRNGRGAAVEADAPTPGQRGFERSSVQLSGVPSPTTPAVWTRTLHARAQ